MTVMVERILSISERLDNLKEQIDRKNNQEQIKQLEQKYKNNVSFIVGYIQIVDYLKKETDFELKSELINKLKDALDVAKDCITNRGINEKYASLLDTKRAECEAQLKKDWKAFYSKKLTTAEGILQIVADLFPSQVQVCRQKINSASVFKPDMNMYVNFVDALKTVNEMISGLNLDEKTKRFLKKISDGTASVNDIDVEILTWIQAAGISTKIKLSFR